MWTGNTSASRHRETPLFTEMVKCGSCMNVSCNLNNPVPVPKQVLVKKLIIKIQCTNSCHGYCPPYSCQNGSPERTVEANI